MIKCIESKKKAKKWFVVIQDKPVGKKPLHDFSVFDSTEKKRLYSLKTSSSDLDTIILVDYPAKNIVGNVEGEWINNIFNVTFSIYDYKLHNWTDGTIKRVSKSFTSKYRIEWKKERLIISSKFYSKTIQIYNERPEELIAEFRYRSVWRSGTKYKYDLKIYSDRIPDAIHFIALTVMHHHEKTVQQD